MWHAVVQRGRVVAITTLLGLAAGVAVSVTSPPTFLYTTVIEIGVNDVNRIDTPSTVVAKLTEDYIPRGLSAYAMAHEGAGAPAVVAREPRDSGLVVIESRGPADELERHTQAHAAILDILTTDHDRMSLRASRDIEAQITATESKMEVDQARDTALGEQLKQVARSKAALELRISQIREAVSAAAGTRAAAASQPNADAAMLLLLDQEIQASRVELAGLETVAYVDLAAEARELELARSDNQRMAADHAAQLDQLESRLDLLQRTRVLAPTLRSATPIGRTPLMTIWMATVLGLAIGLLWALLPLLTSSEPTASPVA